MANRTSRILAVDDNQQNLEILRKTLTTAAYEVITAMDGPTALSLVESIAPDLVLLDVMMPGMSGYEVCERIRANEATCLLPVVMLTSLSDVTDRIRGIETGADDFLTKPFNREELLTRVKSLLRIKLFYNEIETTNLHPRSLHDAYRRTLLASVLAVVS